jgi:Uma2 family endonuclease
MSWITRLDGKGGAAMTVLEQVPPTKSKRKHKPNWQFDTPLDTSEITAMLNALEQLDLPGDDGEPMENERERIQINLGLDLINQAWQDRDDFYAGGNMFVYFSTEQAHAVTAEINDPTLPKKTFRGPDIFIVRRVDGSYRRQKWVTWQEDGRYPDVIFEFLSPSTRHRDLGEKKTLYEQTFHTREYFCYEYIDVNATPRLYGWRLDANAVYQPLPTNERGWIWSEELQLWVGEWYGTVERETALWLRFYTADGDLVLTKAEATQQQAILAEEQAEVAVQRADEAEQRAGEAEQRAGEAEQQAEVAKQQAEEARVRAEQEAAARQAAEAEAAALRAEIARLRGAATSS